METYINHSLINIMIPAYNLYNNSIGNNFYFLFY